MKAERTLFPQIGEQIVQIRLHAASASTINGIWPVLLRCKAIGSDTSAKGAQPHGDEKKKRRRRKNKQTEILEQRAKAWESIHSLYIFTRAQNRTRLLFVTRTGLLTERLAAAHRNGVHGGVRRSLTEGWAS